MWINGKHHAARVFAKEVDQTALDQIARLCDQGFVAGSTIRIMPDVHAGKGSVIGLTMDIQDKVVPNLVGVDIGCGMHTSYLGRAKVDLSLLDRICREIPTGFAVWQKPLATFPLEDLRVAPQITDMGRLQRSLGTLGGGNHFIELNQDEEGGVYLVVHSGSRNLGAQVAEIYQDMAIAYHSGLGDFLAEKGPLKAPLPWQAKKRRKALKAMGFVPKPSEIPPDLAYLTGQDMAAYLHDARLCQAYAQKNRELMTGFILEGLGLEPEWDFHTVHNYLDREEDGKIILRKGAVSAKLDEPVLIPLNMRDGSYLCRGLGNPDWNQSAPHGAGRRMSRKEARASLSLADYQKATAHIHTSSVGASTLDEAPMAYKPPEALDAALGVTVDLKAHLKTVYNFKDAKA